MSEELIDFRFEDFLIRIGVVGENIEENWKFLLKGKGKWIFKIFINLK